MMLVMPSNVTAARMRQRFFARVALVGAGILPFLWAVTPAPAAGASDRGSLRHWALEPVGRPAVPTAADAGQTEIDRFLTATLKSRGLAMAPALPRWQWIRRASFDLIGLPPTWDEVRAFVEDPAPDTQAKTTVIDRLLQSPRYGERWGRHWLDLARYADTHGGSAIGFTKFPFSYTYRDYVIRAFNDDLPYDRFVTEQLAADELDLPANDPALAALGFLTVGMQYRNRHDVIDDQIDVVSRGLMGLTVACARCHDHKFDPISTKDYYSLYAALAPSRTPELPPTLGRPGNGAPYQEYLRELALRQTRYDDMARDQSEVLRGRLRMQVGMYLREIAKGTPEQDTSTGFLSYRTDDIRPIVFNRWRDYLRQMPDSDPVFGAWVRLSSATTNGTGTNRTPAFAQACSNLVQSLQKENGDPAALKNLQQVAVDAPRWNPRVLEALARQAPQSLSEVADVYGALFAEVHQGWLKGLQEASAEAGESGQIVPDEDARHREINSAVNRQLRRHLYGANSPTAVPDDVAAHLLNRPVNDNLAGRGGAIHDLHLNSPGSPARAMVLEESGSPETYHVLRRGNPLDRGAVVEARFLSAVKPNDGPFADSRRRLGLARAIVSRENPLTRRVIVNWVWQQHFGQGLVRTPDDWGTRGNPPTHPELLDHLASALADDGWSIKKLHRRILLSAAYGQASIESAHARDVDPDDALLWRMPRRRLDLEAMRDSLLAVSGELDLSMGGRPVELQAQPAVPRRSVYGFVNRDIVASLFSTFDGANPSSCTAKRPDTTVPQQTLFALNSEFIQDRAAALARLAEKAVAHDDAGRVRWLYEHLYSREPAADELELALAYVQPTGAGAGPVSAKADPAAWPRLAHALLAANEFVFVD